MRVVLFSFIFLVTQNVSIGQVSGYVFSQSMGAYTPITGGTIVGQATNPDPASAPDSAPMDDFTYTSIMIPFTFNLNGAHTTVNINTNGWITFGTSSITATTTAPISSSSAAPAVISPFGRDLMGVFAATGTRTLGSNVITAVSNTTLASIGAVIGGTGIPAGSTITAFDATSITISNNATAASTGTYLSFTTGEIRVETLGSAPNRTFVIQWKGMAQYSTTASTATNNTSCEFQVRLNEAGGNPLAQTVDIVYGTCFRNPNTSTQTGQVGLRGATNTDFNNRSSATDWTATIPGATNSATITWGTTAALNPPSGLKFTWAPPTCFAPSALTAAVISPTGANLSWTAPGSPPSNGYEWEVRTSGLPGSGATGLAASGTTAAGVTMAVVTGLSNDTQHSLYVRGFCGGTDYSVWAGPSTFRTLCAPTSPPYTQDFVSYTGAAPTGLACWAEYDNGSPPGFPTAQGTSVWTSDGFGNNGTTGAARILLSAAANRDWLISPPINLTGGPFQLKADFALTISGSTTQGVFGSDDEVKVLISTDYGSTWTTLETFNTGNPPSNTGTTRIYDLSAYSNMNAIIAFWGNEGIIDNTESVDFFVDNFLVQTPPACPAPGSLTATPTTTGAILGWTELGSATIWDLEIIPAASSPTGVPTHPGITNNPYTWTGGAPVTAYKYYVRANCGGSGVSTWSGPVTFTTKPANDEPAGAINLTLAVAQSINTIGATQTLAACTGTADDDVWYTFTPPADGAYTIAFSGLTGTTDIGYEIFQGLPSGGISLACHDGPDAGASLDGFLSSNTYYIRVYSWTSITTTRITAGNITINNYALSPPSNNNCGGALSVSLSPNGACAYTALTSANATYSLLKPTCITSLNPPAHDDDIWVSFTTDVAGEYTFKTTFAGTYGAELYTGSCGSLTPVPSSCSTSFTGTTGIPRSLAASTSYILRIWKTSTGGAAFDICIERPLPPPVNDNASGAIELLLGVACSGNPYTNVGASLAAGEPYPSCSGIAIVPVWFKFVAPTSGAVRVTLDILPLGTFTDSKAAIFSATDPNDYATFSILSCDDDGGSADVNGYMSVVYATGLTGGVTYYVAVDKWDPSTTAGTFCIQVDELSSSMLSTTNTCSNAIQIPVANGVTNYAEWIPLLDATSKLVAMVRYPVGGGNPSLFAGAQNVHPGAVRNFQGTDYLDRNFYINNASATNFMAQLFFLDAEFNDLALADPSVSNLSDLKITKTTQPTTQACATDFDDQPAMLLNQLTSNSTGGVSWVQFIAPTQGNFFIHGGLVALPIDLLSFNAEGMKNYNMVTWHTASETNAANYLVQRANSFDGNFETIGQVEARNSNGESYSFIDHFPKSIGYYRLKMMDLDGQYKFSNTVLVKRTSDRFSILNVYPVPSADVVLVDITNPESIKTGIVIADITGKTIRTIDTELVEGDQTIQVRLDGLQPGTYFMTIMGQVKRIIKL